MTTTEEPFGLALRRLRERSGLTQEVLAERAGLSARAISALERGQRRHPYPHTVRALARVLGLGEEDRALLEASVAPRGRRPGPPVPPSSLIGREEELRALTGVFESGGTRLLTLTGPGGVGKTRLALALAEEVADRFTEGAVFVPLAAIPDPELVLPAIARGLDVQPPDGAAVGDVLHAYLRGRSLLLVLDNLEHVAGAGPDVAELLAAAPRLHVLATSRTPLRLRAERTYPVAPLAPEQAATLFRERAAEAAPHAPWADRLTVDEICRRLDGLPLAIELAAARTRVLPPRALLARLDRPFGLLRGGARDLPERQQALERAVAWSHDLLGPPERALFRRLAAFPGGWALDDASAIVELDETTALELHTALVDGSLVVPRADTDEPRFEMLDTIRAYAAERLGESEEADAIRARHAAHYHDLLLRAAREIWSPAQLAWLDRLDLDRPNVRDAFRWSLARGDVERAAHACFALCLVGWAGVPFQEEEMLGAGALAGDPSLSTVGRAKLLFTTACVGVLGGRLDGLSGKMATAVELVREAGETETLAWMLTFHGSMRGLLGDVQESMDALDEAAALARRLGIPDVVIRASNFRARIDFMAGRAAEAERRLVGAVAEAGEGAAPWTLGSIPVIRGRFAIEIGELDRAEGLLRGAVAAMGRLRDRDCVGTALVYLAALATRRADGASAAGLLGAADALIERGHFVLRPYDRALDEECRRAAAEQLGADAYEARYLYGRELPYDDVIELVSS